MGKGSFQKFPEVPVAQIESCHPHREHLSFRGGRGLEVGKPPSVPRATPCPAATEYYACGE